MQEGQLTRPLPTASFPKGSRLFGEDVFLAVDVETANADPSSICQIAVVRFDRGGAIDIWHSMIDPCEPFATLNVALHGIDEAAVANAPKFPQVVNILAERLSGNVVATHMPFDRVAIQSALTKHCLEPFQCSWLDTASIARRAWPRFAKRGYGLKSLADWCGIQLRHHDAVADATAAGLIFSRAMADTDTNVAQWLTNSFGPNVQETRIELVDRDS